MAQTCHPLSNGDRRIAKNFPKKRGAIKTVSSNVVIPVMLEFQGDLSWRQTGLLRH
ncbi:hypothetical protein [Lyngbya aestuarii]|uniref:hypothetical protein n=1 Tax=Lyngbya aestuarii TaxID=118322 RepID=UPI00403DF043